MGVLKRLDGNSISESGIQSTDCLTMYDQYGAMAYGVILQIVPEPEAAQQILVDLFTSLQDGLSPSSSTNLACVIIRLARQKALEAKVSSNPSASLPEPISAENDNRPKLVFDMSFKHGYTPRAISERLQIPYIDVMKAIRDYFKYLRISQSN